MSRNKKLLNHGDVALIQIGLAFICALVSLMLVANLDSQYNNGWFFVISWLFFIAFGLLIYRGTKNAYLGTPAGVPKNKIHLKSEKQARNLAFLLCAVVFVAHNAIVWIHIYVSAGEFGGAMGGFLNALFR